MSSIIGYYIAAFHLGIIVAIPPGSVTFVGIQYALQQRFSRTLLFIIGSTCVDLFYLSLAYSGFDLISSMNRYVLSALYLFCSFLLIGLSVKTIFSVRNYKSRNSVPVAGKRSSFTTGVLVTIANPATIAGWFAIAGNFFLFARTRWQLTTPMEIMALGVIQSGVLFYFIPFLFIVSKLRTKFPLRLEKGLLIVSSLLLIILGLLVLNEFIKSLGF
ncbi:MAG: LysE family transporter [Spirochaetes bacterium]|jgi:threonine/homoserine/homoserine lactone efflux protein|nr:LysE family transporter [Spirochaetota bacterium]